MPVLNWMGRLREDLQIMEEGNLIGTKTGPYGEGGGSDPAGRGVVWRCYFGWCGQGEVEIL